MASAQNAGGEVMNPLFSTLRRPASLPGHETRRNALALLSAIDAAVGPGSGGALGPVAYLGSLASVLSSNPGPSESEAALTLLDCVVPAVPGPAMSRAFGEVSAAVVAQVSPETPEGAAASIVKRGVAVLEGMLRKVTVASVAAQQGKGALAQWGDAEVAAFNALLTLTACPRPKARKRAVAAVVEVMSLGGVAHRKHVAGTQAVRFLKHVVSGCRSSDVVPALHALYAAARFAPYLSTAASFELISTLMRLPTVGSPMLTVKAFDTIAALFSSPDCALSGKNVSQTVAALWDLQPPRAEAEQVRAHATALTAAQLRLSAADAKLSAERLPRTVAAVFSNFLSGHRPVAAAAAGSVGSLVVDAISDDMIMEALHEARGDGGEAVKVRPDSDVTPVRSIANTLRSGLDYRFADALDLVLLVNAALFERLGDAAAEVLPETLAELGALWDTDAVRGRRDELTMAIGEAIAVMGPVAFLRVLPMNIEAMLVDGDSSPVRDWILPLLRDHVRNTRLSEFGTYFLPLAGRISARAAELEAAGPARAIEAKTLRILYTQVWALFPGFCTGPPRDVVESFPKLARTVGVTIAQEPLVRQHAVQGLRNLIDGLVAVAASGEDEGVTAAEAETARAGIAVVAPLARNFLPVLLNAYRALANDGTGTHREYVLQCVSSYAGIAEPALTNDVFRTAVRKLLEATAGTAPQVQGEAAAQVRRDMVDIAMSIVERLDDESASLLYRVVRPQLSGDDASLQKKSYAALAKLCFRPGFLAGHGEDLAAAVILGDEDGDDAAGDDRARDANDPVSLIREPSTAVSAGARLPRLRVLRHIVAAIPAAAAPSFVARLLPEVVLGTRESNGESRTEAFDLLVAFGHKLAGADVDPTSDAQQQEREAIAEKRGPRRGWTPADEDAAENAPPGAVDGLRGYLELLVACLAARTPRMLAATVTSISRVLYEFAPLLAPSVPDLLETLFLLYNHRAREVGGAVLGFSKVAIAALDPVAVTPHIPTMVEGAVAWSNHSKAYKVRARTVLERLVRKFSYDVVDVAMPESDKKLLVHIRRMNDRHERDKRERERERGKAGSRDKDARAGDAGERRRQFDALLEDTDDEDGAGAGARGRAQTRQQQQQQQQQRGSAAGVKRGRGGAGDGPASYLTDDGTAVDLLDTRQVMQSVTSTLSGGKRGRSGASSSGGGDAIKMGRDGRLVVPDDDGGDRAKKRRRGGDGDDSDGGDDVDRELQATMDVETAGENLRGAARRGNRGLRLKLRSDATASGTTTWSSALERKVRQGAGGGAGTGANAGAAAGGRAGDAGGRGGRGKAEAYGSAYRPRKEGTGGDMKVKGKPDPYAFVPLGGPAKRKGPAGKVHDKGLVPLVRNRGKGSLGQTTRAKRSAAKKKGGRR